MRESLTIGVKGKGKCFFCPENWKQESENRVAKAWFHEMQSFEFSQNSATECYAYKVRSARSEKGRCGYKLNVRDLWFDVVAACGPTAANSKSTFAFCRFGSLQGTCLFVWCFKINKLASLEATLVRNSVNWLTHSALFKCRATSSAKNYI